MAEQDSLELEHVEGKTWKANTPHGRRDVILTTVSFSEVVAYSEGERLYAHPVKGLSKIISTKVNRRLWILDEQN